MYGLWWIVIISGILTTVGIVLLICGDEDNYLCLGFGIILIILMGATFLVCLGFSIINPICAKQEYQTFEIQKEFVQEAYENGTDADNIAITQTVIEMNTWLAEAKASKQTLGNWSAYYNIDLDSLEPITLERDNI